jgi:hypothetical protein
MSSPPITPSKPILQVGETASTGTSTASTPTRKRKNDALDAVQHAVSKIQVCLETNNDPPTPFTQATLELLAAVKTLMTVKRAKREVKSIAASSIKDFDFITSLFDLDYQDDEHHCWTLAGKPHCSLSPNIGMFTLGTQLY